MSKRARWTWAIVGVAASAAFVAAAVAAGPGTTLRNLSGLFGTVAVAVGVMYGTARLVARRRLEEDAAAFRRRLFRVTALGCLITLAVGLLLFGLCLAVINNSFG